VSAESVADEYLDAAEDAKSGIPISTMRSSVGMVPTITTYASAGHITDQLPSLGS